MLELPQRMQDKIQPEPNCGCWFWMGWLNPKGYGKVWDNDCETMVYVHRYTYEFLVAPVPTGMVLDHLCRMRSCCNPDHLEPVSNKVNCHRGNTGKHLPALNRKRAMEAKQK